MIKQDAVEGAIHSIIDVVHHRAVLAGVRGHLRGYPLADDIHGQCMCRACKEATCNDMESFSCKPYQWVLYTRLSYYLQIVAV